MTHDELLAKIKKEIQSYDGHNEVCKEWLALRAVVELHKPKPLDERGDVCLACCPDLLTPYPCPTIQAVEKELG
jgi:hypothetical protein